MVTEHKELIWISTQGPIHGNYGLQIWTDNERKLNVFYSLAMKYFFDEDQRGDFGAFIQGGAGDIHLDKVIVGPTGGWLYFEFWKSNRREVQEAILNLALIIAEEVDLPLEII